MREIVLDTETTGLDPAAGHRIVEIGAVEMVNLVPTANRFQKYINPERDMPEEARAVHGLTEEFLSGQPTFAEVARAAEAAGHQIVHIPVSGGLREGDIIRFNEAWRAMPKPVLAYCRSGARAGSLYQTLAR